MNEFCLTPEQLELFPPAEGEALVPPFFPPMNDTTMLYVRRLHLYARWCSTLPKNAVYSNFHFDLLKMRERFVVKPDLRYFQQQVDIQSRHYWQAIKTPQIPPTHLAQVISYINNSELEALYVNLRKQFGVPPHLPLAVNFMKCDRGYWAFRRDFVPTYYWHEQFARPFMQYANALLQVIPAYCTYQGIPVPEPLPELLTLADFVLYEEHENMYLLDPLPHTLLPKKRRKRPKQAINTYARGSQHHPITLSFYPEPSSFSAHAFFRQHSDFAPLSTPHLLSAAQLISQTTTPTLAKHLGYNAKTVREAFTSKTESYRPVGVRKAVLRFLENLRAAPAPILATPPVPSALVPPLAPEDKLDKIIVLLEALLAKS